MNFVKKSGGEAGIQIRPFGGNAENAVTEVQGFFLGTRSLKTSFGPKLAHFFKNGVDVVGVWGRSVLDRQLSEETVGTMLKVVYAGLKQGKNKSARPYHNFDVYEAPETTLDVSTLDVELPGEAVVQPHEQPVSLPKATKFNQLVRR